jgi:hypothetical protein
LGITISVSFEFGQGVAQDWAAAVRYYRLAAEQGYADAQCNLGVCFEIGKAVAQNQAEAVYYYRLAAAQADALSSETLAKITTACDRIACSAALRHVCTLVLRVVERATPRRSRRPPRARPRPLAV